jgi:hypothetical protein
MTRRRSDRTFAAVVHLNTEAKAADYLRRAIRAGKAMVITDALFDAIELGSYVLEAADDLAGIGRRIKPQPIDDESDGH